MKHKDSRPWLSVIASGESLASYAGATLLVETGGRSGLAKQLSAGLASGIGPPGMTSRRRTAGVLAKTASPTSTVRNATEVLVHICDELSSLEVWRPMP